VNLIFCGAGRGTFGTSFATLAVFQCFPCIHPRDNQTPEKRGSNAYLDLTPLDSVFFDSQNESTERRWFVTGYRRVDAVRSQERYATILRQRDLKGSCGLTQRSETFYWEWAASFEASAVRLFCLNPGCSARVPQ
jgi:hypothetical protein